MAEEVDLAWQKSRGVLQKKKKKTGCCFIRTENVCEENTCQDVNKQKKKRKNLQFTPSRQNSRHLRVFLPFDLPDLPLTFLTLHLTARSKHPTTPSLLLMLHLLNCRWTFLVQTIKTQIMDILLFVIQTKFWATQASDCCCSASSSHQQPLQ